MMRHRIIKSPNKEAGGGGLRNKMFTFRPVQERMMMKGKSVTVWLVGSIVLSAVTMCCTWMAYYPTSLILDTDVQLAALYTSSDRRTNSVPGPRQRTLQDRHRKRHLAWLLSFPNSGTTYTLENMEQVSNFSTATNYENEILSDIIYPVNPEMYDAPFVFSPHLEVPNFVLTKTHCVGFCDTCHHSTITYDVPSFEFGCMKSVIQRDCTPERRFYDVDDVRKAVHLVRDPFDNIVSRMHLHVKVKKEDGTVPTHVLDQFADTPQGIRAWCDYVDKMFHDKELTQTALQEPGGYNPISEDTMKLLQSVPCHSEWFRYAQWHNLTTTMLEMHHVEKHVLYYEDYTERLLSTTNALSAFLEQPVLNEPRPFISGKTYQHLYNDEEKAKVQHLIKALVTEATWTVLRRYFKKADDERDSSTGTTLSSSSPVIIWLISFPQSAAQYLIHLVESMSQVSTAANLGQGYDKKMWPEAAISSPVWSNADLERANRVLTRTHCIVGGTSSLPVEDTQMFSRKCRTVLKQRQGNVTHGLYDMSRVKGAITLVRDPFRVIHSRIKRMSSRSGATNWTKQERLQRRESRVGMEEFCRIVDAKYEQLDGSQTPKPLSISPPPSNNIGLLGQLQDVVQCPVRLFASGNSKMRFSMLRDEVTRDAFEYKRRSKFALSADVVSLFKELPCYSEWLRYIQFYNHAFDLVEKFQWKTVHFEQLSSHSEETGQQILDYLEQPRKGDPIPLDKERAKGMNHYTSAEARLAAKLVRKLATEATWNALHGYFQSEEWYDANEIEIVKSVHDVTQLS